MGKKVLMPRWIPNTYCPEIDSSWLTYTTWRDFYQIANGIEPPFYANLDGEVWYAYFKSPVDSKLPDNMIRVLSAEISQDYGSIFVNELTYHFTETKEAMREGWSDIEEELFYLADTQYLQSLNRGEQMVYCGEFKTYKDFLEYIRIEFDSTN
tara:strand:- start:540 stop:998 length:459 start_codon:yes stop_codon:yes gene_type:complete